MKKFLVLTVSDGVLIMLIKVKMPTIVGFKIYEQDKFRAQLSWAWQKVYNLGAWFLVPSDKTIL